MPHEYELRPMGREIAPVLRGLALAVGADPDLGLDPRVHRCFRAGGDVEAEFDVAAALFRAHDAGEGLPGAVELEEDRLVRFGQAAVFVVLEELPADDVAVVAEAVGEVAVAGVEPDAGE